MTLYGPGCFIQPLRRLISEQRGNVLFNFSQHLTTAQPRLSESLSTSTPSALFLMSHMLELLRGMAIIFSKRSVSGAIRLFADSDATDV